MRTKFGKTTLSTLLLILLAAALSPALAAGKTRLTPAEKRVRHALVTLSYLTLFDNLRFTVKGSKVVLAGEVIRPSLKSSAEAAVKRLEEIAVVDNRIEVLPVSNYDDRLRIATFRAIYGHPYFTRYAQGVLRPIRIIVKNGNLTLEGMVRTQTDKNVASIRAKGVSGLFSVTNNLVVEKT